MKNYHLGNYFSSFARRLSLDGMSLRLREFSVYWMARSKSVCNTREGKAIRKKMFKSHQQGSPIGATRLKREEE